MDIPRFQRKVHTNCGKHIRSLKVKKKYIQCNVKKNMINKVKSKSSFFKIEAIYAAVMSCSS